MIFFILSNFDFVKANQVYEKTSNSTYQFSFLDKTITILIIQSEILLFSVFLLSELLVLTCFFLVSNAAHGFNGFSVCFLRSILNNMYQIFDLSFRQVSILILIIQLHRHFSKIVDGVSIFYLAFCHCRNEVKQSCY